MSAYLNSTNVSSADDGKLLQIQVNYIIQYQTYSITSNYTVLNFYQLFAGKLFIFNSFLLNVFVIEFSLYHVGVCA